MSKLDFTLADYRIAADAVRSQTRHAPQIALILGSGLGSLAQAVQEADIVPFNDIPYFPHSSVLGHSNRLVIGLLEGKPILVMQGRIHFYEGHSMTQVTFPIRMMQVFGIKTLIVTNAAGGLNPAFRAGDLMLINDHLNFIGMAGHNPLIGPNNEALGPRFPDMTVAYDADLRALARKVAAERGITLREGVYAGIAGPNFETPAEVRMLRILGADAVGMSTVSEVTVARHGGLRVLGLSGITNMAIDDPLAAKQEVSHAEVLDIGARKIAPDMTALLRGVLAGMGA